MDESLRHLAALLENATIEALLWSLLALEVCASLSVPSVLLRRRGRPTSALAWLLALFALPAIGFIAWWLFGRTRIERKLRKHSQRKQAFLQQQGAPSVTESTRFDALLPMRARDEYAFASGGNHATLLLDGEKAFPALEEKLGTAEECILMLFYIFELDETGRRLIQRLIERAQAGVRVRLLLDGLGSHRTARRIRRLLAPHGIEVAIFLPSRLWPLYAPRLNFVNHRKIVVIDNHIAFTGGMNVADHYRRDWRDLMVQLEGPVVAGLNHVLLEDWYFATGEALSDPRRSSHQPFDNGFDAAVVSSGPDTEGWIHDAYFLAITRATQTITRATPYFVPTQPILTALRTAAGRGVEVRLIVPSLSDVSVVKWASRSFYPLLVETGVRIFEYGGAMLHAKAMVIDGQTVAIGSANIDNRSFRLNFEVNCFLHSVELSEQLNTWLHALLAESAEMTAQHLEQKGLPRKLLESAAHLFSPLL